MAFKASPEAKGGLESLQRPLGQQELHHKSCHTKSKGSMNIICGLTLVTRHQIDEGKTFQNKYFSHISQFKI